MKNIIYLTDFSENSVSALKYSHELSKYTQLEVTVLHVFDPTDIQQLKSPLEKARVLEHHKKRLENFCSLNLGENFSNLHFKTEITKGKNIPASLFKALRNIDVLVLIMGACGSGTIKEFSMGRTTKKVIAGATFPVLVIPSTFKYRPLEANFKF